MCKWMLGTYYKIWTYPVRISKISQTSTLTSPLNMCDNLPYPRFASVESPWLTTIHFKVCMHKQMPVPVAARSKVCVCGCSLDGISGSPQGAWMSVRCECCVLSDRGLCDGLITRPEESYRLWCVGVCDPRTS